MVHPIRPPGAVHPGAQPAAPGKPGKEAVAFTELLKGALPAAPPEAPAAPDPRLEQAQRFAAEALGTEAWEARLLESYDMLSADEALFEVQTSKGAYQVIRSRMGGMSVYPAP